MRQINYYEFKEAEPDWAELKKAFKKNISRHKVPFFVAGSELEKQFINFCKSFGFGVISKSIMEYDGDTSDKAKYVYLTTKSDDGKCIASATPSFIDVSSACTGGGAFGICNKGAIQVGKVVVNSRGIASLDKLDLIGTTYPFVPKIYLLSERLARVILDAKATGCEIVPCEVEGIRMSSTSQACYQLRITAQTKGPAKIGQVELGKRCPVCSAVKFFLSNRGRHFSISDLQEVDFQLCNTYESVNAGQFVIPLGFPIVSRRIFDLLLGLNIGGLNRYSTDPPIQAAIVEVVV